MNVKQNSSLNGGSGGLSNGPQKIVIDAGCFKSFTLDRREERNKVIRRILVAVAIVAMADSARRGGEYKS